MAKEKKIKFVPMTGSELIAAINPTPLERRRAHEVFVALQRRRATTAQRRTARKTPKPAASAK
jgi:hypothetical protein